MRDCYIFDIDGTVADCTHRIHFIEKGYNKEVNDYGVVEQKDWESFFAKVGEDYPIPHIIRVCQMLGVYDLPIVFATGRSERTRQSTLDWFDKHGLLHVMSALYMRADGDHRPDDIVKRDMLHRIRVDGWNPILAFDDRDCVVDMWRANGVPCAQVAPGDF